MGAAAVWPTPKPINAKVGDILMQLPVYMKARDVASGSLSKADMAC